ncbi:MAG: hypothetical protein KHX37_09965, partial [Eubacterium sp.]|nr:hypothetical protein [Eubacterium sp.]
MEKKKFFDVFQTIKLNDELTAMFEYVDITKIATNVDHTKMRIYIESSRLIEKSAIFTVRDEIARNLFSYGLEIENIYVLGSFSVKVNNFTLNKNVLYVEDGIFAITKEKKIEQGFLTPQGLWFYRGQIATKIKFPKLKEGEKGFIFLSGGEHCSATLEVGSKKVKNIFLYE